MPVFNRLVIYIFILSCITGIVYSCAHGPYADANKIYKKQTKQFAKELRSLPNKLVLDSVVTPDEQIGTTNFDLRKPNFVIIHHTAQNSCEETIRTFTLQRTKVSAHYVVCKDGTIHHLLNDYMRAWQAGVSRWGNFTDINSSSIGIEIDNDGYEPFTQPQITSLLHLLDTLKKKYSIPTPNFIGHADVAPGRKVDPGKFFPWQMLAERGFGLWYDTTNVTVPENFNPMIALRIIGYNIKDSLSAIQSYKLHFVQWDSTKAITAGDKKILADLMRKYQ
jgi:N-acetylmuramoyl-L-alanine amidase